MAAVHPESTYRVIRNERVGIGNFDRRLVTGDTYRESDLPEGILQALLDGQMVEEIETPAEPAPEPTPEA